MEINLGVQPSKCGQGGVRTREQQHLRLHHTVQFLEARQPYLGLFLQQVDPLAYIFIDCCSSTVCSGHCILQHSLLSTNGFKGMAVDKYIASYFMAYYSLVFWSVVDFFLKEKKRKDIQRRCTSICR